MSAPSLDLKEIREVADAASPGAWAYIASTEHHGPYVSWYGDICDCYTMSNPSALSTRSGGDSKPVHFQGENADANAKFIASARTWVPALVDRITELEGKWDKSEAEAERWQDQAQDVAGDAISALRRAEAAQARLATAEGLLRGVDMAIAYTATGAKWVGLDAGANSDWLKQRDDFLTVKPASAFLSNQKEAGE